MDTRSEPVYSFFSTMRHIFYLFSSSENGVSNHKQKSTDEYVKEGLGPNVTAINNTEYPNSATSTAATSAVQVLCSRHYDTMDSGHRVSGTNREVATDRSATGGNEY